MLHRSSCVAAAALVLGFGPAGSAAQDPPTDRFGPVPVDSIVERVVLYPGGADIERSADLDLDPGVHELVFRGIADPDGEGLPGLRASASKGWAVVGVQVVPASSGSERRTARDRFEAARADAEDRLARLLIEAEGLDSDLALIEAIGVRATAEATEVAGTGSLDLESLRRQLDFVGSERKRIRLERLSLERDLDRLREAVEESEARLRDLAASSERVAARVRVAVAEAGAGTVSIRYLRSAASWSPVYSIRSEDGRDTMLVDYEASVRQATGEPWTDVEVVLSTARPSTPGRPLDIQPVFVDRRRPEAAVPDVASLSVEARAGTDSPDDRTADDVWSRLSSAEAKDGGSSLTLRLSETASIASEGVAPTRLGIASIDAPTERVLVTRPVVEEKVFLRGDLVNRSPFVLLAGEAGLFMEGEYVGPFELEEVPAGGEFEVWFGPTPEITSRRQVLARRTQKTGLLGGGLQTTIDYRIDLRNDGPEAATVEVWDRRPVSRDDEIEIQIVDAEPPVADDAVYRGLAERRGLLKWVIQLGPGGTPEAARQISWTVRVNRSSDLDATPIPD